MADGRYTAREIVARGEEIYERELRERLERKHHGEFLVLDIDTGEYEVDANEVEAVKRAMMKRPDGARYIKRVGFRTAHRIGAGSGARA